MRAFIVCVVWLVGCCETAWAQQSLLNTANDIGRVAKLICRGAYGNTRPQVNQDTLRYYCGRLQHPESFLQDLEWWKQHAPAFLQAKPEPKLDPVHMTPYERDMQQAFLGNCRSRGGPESVCQRCAGLLLLARRRDSVCMKWGS